MAAERTRAFVGLATVMTLIAIFLLSIGLFRGVFTESVPVTVISQRAGLVMNPDAKVKMRGVEVGKVGRIDYRPDGTAALTLAMDPAQMDLIPSNITVDIESSTVFGAKFVRLTAPFDPSPEPLREGQVLQGDHVTTEINTVFQQLTTLLDRIDPAKLNQTLGAISKAFNGRGDKLGQTMVDFNALLAKIEPSLPNLSHDIEASVPMLTAYGDASADVMSTLKSATTISNSLVDQQQNLDAFLVSAIGLADISNGVIGSNRQGLTDVAHLLVPTTALLAEYHDALRCGLGGLVPFAKSPPQYSGVVISSGLTLGVERYRYPGDLPKVAAKSGGANYCDILGLPVLKPEFVPPFIAGDVGSNPAQYGNSGILLNSEGLKNWLFGPLDGPPRNGAQVGMPG